MGYYDYDVKKLTRTNKIVFKKYCKNANDLQKAQMRTTLKQQIENLSILYSYMIQES